MYLEYFDDNCNINVSNYKNILNFCSFPKEYEAPLDCSILEKKVYSNIFKKYFMSNNFKFNNECCNVFLNNNNKFNPYLNTLYDLDFTSLEDIWLKFIKYKKYNEIVNKNTYEKIQNDKNIKFSCYAPASIFHKKTDKEYVYFEKVYFKAKTVSQLVENVLSYAKQNLMQNLDYLKKILNIENEILNFDFLTIKERFFLQGHISQNLEINDKRYKILEEYLKEQYKKLFDKHKNEIFYIPSQNEIIKVANKNIYIIN